ncbi:MAG: signal peptidase II [Firmicutes bacterium]|nr:signal peptidase II [Bacillota bacterium]
MREGKKEIESEKTSFFSPWPLFGAGRLKKRQFSFAAFFSVAALVFFLDQLSKSWVVGKLAPGETQALIPGIFYLTYVRNPGAAFGLLAHKTSFFIVVALFLAIIILLSCYFLSNRYVLFRFGLSLLLGGAMGNLFDRLKTGYVIDFLDFRIWPVFNLADTAITIGVILLFISFLRNKTYFFSSEK